MDRPVKESLYPKIDRVGPQPRTEACKFTTGLLRYVNTAGVFQAECHAVFIRLKAKCLLGREASNGGCLGGRQISPIVWDHIGC